MLKEFQNLNPTETAAMLDAIPNIVILVAAADDNMDEEELAAAQRLADIRSFAGSAKLSAYYETIDDTLVSRVKELYAGLPKELSAREAILFERLAALEPIIAKLESPFDYLYSETFHTFARYVAEAHGGFLRFFTVGPKEAKVVDLPMLTRVPKPEDPKGLL
ncbi:hypothetical protein CEQ90_00685 [Lewinellaceae bacterium SD302]|nr:hypothetical protein CEQ90_00685 [Lewinellaceae bacterium SD302]